MNQQSIHTSAETAGPNNSKKRTQRPEEEEVPGNDDAKKRRFEQRDACMTGSVSATSDHQACLHVSDQLLRGRTRWREGSEPPGWDCREFHARRSTIASYDDSPRTEENPNQNSRGEPQSKL
ncbi:hypothetical protein V8C42DRAFT_344856 [Trichoderma barbatum]